MKTKIVDDVCVVHEVLEVTCGRCHGTKRVKEQLFGGGVEDIPCPHCDGKGTTRAIRHRMVPKEKEDKCATS